MKFPSFLLHRPGFDPQLRPIAVPPSENSHISVDRIALSAPAIYFNKELVPQWYSTKGINLIDHGERVFINVHPEWYSGCDSLSYRVFTAVFYLNHVNVLNQSFRDRMKEILSTGYYNEKTAGPHWPTQLLSKLFELAEWETSLDFYDYPVVKSWSPEDFHLVSRTTVYSNDNRQLSRIRDGKEQSKGRKDSFIMFYDRHLVTKDKNRKCYRLEFLHAKENAEKDLPWELLNGDETDAYYSLLPSIVLNLQRLTKPANLVFDSHWIQFAPDWFKHLLLAAGWLDPATNTMPPPRRPKGASASWSLEASKLIDWDKLG